MKIIFMILTWTCYLDQKSETKTIIRKIKLEIKSPYLWILQISEFSIVVVHASDLFWYPHGDTWSEHRDHWCASTLQILLLSLGSASLLLDLEEEDHCVNSFMQIHRNLNQIIKKGRRTFLFLFFSLFFSLRSDHH